MLKINQVKLTQVNLAQINTAKVNTIPAKVVHKMMKKVVITTLIAMNLMQVSFAADVVEKNETKVVAKPVKAAPVLNMPMAAKTELNATLYSRSHIPITASLNARVDYLVEPGDFVAQGDKLAGMDLLPIQLRQAEQKAQISRARINVAYIKNELSRLQALSKTQAVSQFKLDQMRSEHDLAAADLEIAQLKLAQINEQLSRAIITAPFAGIITERLIRVGSEVNRGDILLRLLDTEHLEARLYIPIKYLAFINKGDKLSMSASDQKTLAAVTAKIPRADPRSQTFEVRLNIPKAFNKHWAAGQLVSVSVPTQKATASLTVPRDALILRKSGSYVIKVNADNTVSRLAVVVGKGNKERVAITGSLKHGDNVAIRGAERLADGDKVVIQ
ncbi:efflux RND transporter periplasmic adaptor subunit [Colwellia sp. Bg11-28]|uniref:efflux RND transporter periplasmic adaptor subunit n=1 Tax=Colwellia sp. Bg11-28 TaxID=2058305 RepID=UPI000C31C3C4|nr:efflux RND transporter periplasmic adaptor subunit [Colwellia sp. Bg11-28]PKH87641.1 efflux RND transporter periplasmic adaptor subunit [Colwellia sp. Bg11-28]